ncbi:hypothetical protein PEDI_50310 [Persicobacter diffluens]|uniref:Uncharacterized protein n=1 Tax=Persicobacter diffluens TaxID=981 RepID=A0AAN5AMI2_9BACT|nr:hypothetical protein PEDI_50310 [Persicobacter diffluens]
MGANTGAYEQSMLCIREVKGSGASMIKAISLKNIYIA